MEESVIERDGFCLSGGDGGNCTRVRKVRSQVTTSLASLCVLARTDSTSGIARASRVRSRQPLPAWRLPNPDLITPFARVSGEHERRRRETSRGPAFSRYWLTPRAEEQRDLCECSHLSCSCFIAGRIRGLPPAISPPRRTYSSPIHRQLYHETSFFAFALFQGTLNFSISVAFRYRLTFVKLPLATHEGKLDLGAIELQVHP